MKTPCRYPSHLLALVAALLASPIANANEPKKRRVPPVLAPVEDIAGLPRVLLIGDSISMGYTLGVRERLRGKANVHRPSANCGPTTRGLDALDEWLDTGGADKTWDVIHFNWGLHDLKYQRADGTGLADPEASGSRQQVPPAEYEKNLRALVERLQQTKAELIWCSTTPVPEGAQGRIPGEAARYNAIAAKVMTENDIPTHNLHAFVKPRMDQLMRPANVHFKPEGSKALAEKVVSAIEKALPDEE